MCTCACVRETEEASRMIIGRDIQLTLNPNPSSLLTIDLYSEEIPTPIRISTHTELRTAHTQNIPTLYVYTHPATKSVCNVVTDTEQWSTIASSNGHTREPLSCHCHISHSICQQCSVLVNEHTHICIPVIRVCTITRLLYFTPYC